MSLTIGSLAPEIRVSQWLQGGPIASFETGHIYVVEFWATWCGPCKATIPHLSKLAKQHEGKVTVIGVDIWERGGGVEKVQAFVTQMGDKMSYPVAIDSEDDFMAIEWMQASGRQGIPSSFVVDKAGRIAWIGHPSGGLDEVLNQLIAGAYDPQASIQQLEDEQKVAEMRRKQQQSIAPFISAIEQKDYKAALEAVEVLEKSAPDNRSLVILRLQAAISCEVEQDALAIAGQIANDPTAGHLLVPLGITIAQLPESSERMIHIGVAALERLLPIKTSEDLTIFALYGLSLLQTRLDARAKAIEYIDEALKECVRAGETARQFFPMLEEHRRSLTE